MPLEITVGQNSYCTLAEADSYHETRFGNDLWLATSESEKVRALIGACNLLDTVNWIGDKVSPTQTLAWPRTVSSAVIVETLKDIKFAQAELAFQLLRGYLANSSVTKLKVGSLQIDTKNQGQFPLEVNNLIVSYINYQPRLIRT